jgi:hypothetical protein
MTQRSAQVNDDTYSRRASAWPRQPSWSSMRRALASIRFSPLDRPRLACRPARSRTTSTTWTRFPDASFSRFAVQQRGEPGHRHRQQAAARGQHPPRLGQGQGLPALSPPSGDTAARTAAPRPGTHQARRARAHRPARRRTGRPAGAGCLACLACLVHVQRHRIDQMHPLSAPGQRRGIGTRPPPTSRTRAGGAGSSRFSSSIDRTYSSDGCPPGTRRERS